MGVSSPDESQPHSVDFTQTLRPCRACQRYVRVSEVVCPFCDEPLAESEDAYQQILSHAAQSAVRLQQFIGQLNHFLTETRMADSGTGGFGGVHVLYGVVIGEAIARGDVTQMQKVLADSKSLLASQGDLKTQISNLEAAISQVTRGPGGGAAASKGDGLFVVDLKSLALPPERLEAIQSAIRDVVVNALADLDQVVTRGPEAFGPPHTMGIVIRDI